MNRARDSFHAVILFRDELVIPQLSRAGAHVLEIVPRHGDDPADRRDATVPAKPELRGTEQVPAGLVRVATGGPRTVRSVPPTSE